MRYNFVLPVARNQSNFIDKCSCIPDITVWSFVFAHEDNIKRYISFHSTDSAFKCDTSIYKTSVHFPPIVWAHSNQNIDWQSLSNVSNVMITCCNFFLNVDYDGEDTIDGKRPTHIESTKNSRNKHPELNNGWIKAKCVSDLPEQNPSRIIHLFVLLAFYNHLIKTRYTSAEYGLF